MDDFYDRVKHLVKREKTTLRKFIISLDLNYDTYYSQKTAGNLPRLDDAVRIACALGTTVEYLVTGDGPKPLTADDAFAEIEGVIKKYQRGKRA